MAKRYRRLRGDTAYYPFAARTGLRAQQKRHARRLRIAGGAALLLAGALFLRQTVFRGGQPEPPAPVAPVVDHATEESAHVQILPVAATRDALSRTEEADAAAHTTPEAAATPAPEQTAKVLSQYQALYEQNPDLVGWLRIEGTGIDLPVVQTPGDNEYYLRRGFDKVYSLAGSLFLDENCRITSPSTANWLIYGHNMSDGSMFGQLDKYAEESFYREHPTFEFDTLYEEMQWQIVAVIRTQVGADDLPYYTFFDASSERDWQAKYQAVMDLALYDTGVTAQYGDQLLTLSTCGTTSSTTDKRLAVIAKRID